MQNNVILNGDNTEIIKTIDDESIHLILSDIPYGINYEQWDVIHNNTNSALLKSSPAQIKSGSIFKNRGKPLNGWSKADKQIPIEYYNWCYNWSKEWFRVLKPSASAFVFAGRRLAHRCISAFEDNGFIYKDMICWQKESAPYKAQRISLVYERRKDFENADKWNGWRVGNLRPMFEPILWFIKPYKIGETISDCVIDNELGAHNAIEWSRYSANTSNIISVKSQKDDHKLHPTQKPVELMEALIKLTTLEGQTVLDPFCGSGTTLVASKKIKRNYIGIEIDKDYYNIAVNRINGI